MTKKEIKEIKEMKKKELEEYNKLIDEMMNINI